MLLIALTGGIASGKTAVSDHFQSLGVPIVDADLLAREVVQPGSAGLNGLVEHFGNAILTANGELDRSGLRNIIFNIPEAKQAADGLLHPLIKQLSDERLAALEAAQHLYAIYAIPLLIETGQTERFDRIVVVDVPEAVQIQRLTERDDINEEDAKRILAAQATRDERLAIATDIIDNTGTLDDLKLQVENLHAQYLALAAS